MYKFFKVQSLYVQYGAKQHYIQKPRPNRLETFVFIAYHSITWPLMKVSSTTNLRLHVTQPQC